MGLFERQAPALSKLLVRHQWGDWGDVPIREAAANDRAVKRSRPIASLYRLASGRMVWITTDADRTATTILLDEER